MKKTLIKVLKERGFFYITFFIMNLFIDLIFDLYDTGHIIGWLICIILFIVSEVIVIINKKDS